MPFLLAVCGGIGVTIVVSLVSFFVFVKPFYKIHRFLPIVTTIALSMMLDATILLFFHERPRTMFPGVKRIFSFWDMHVNVAQVTLMLLTLLLLMVLAFVLHSTAFGRRLRAVVSNDHAATSLGIATRPLHLLLYTVSAVLATCGGIFISIDQSLSPTLAFSITIKAYSAIIAGGKGNIWGAILCAYLIALLEQLIVGIHWFSFFYVPAGFQSSIALIIIILFLLFKPSGLFVRTARAG
jgi:branched-subunit amino acid ABC-type transport system permease component